MRSSGTSTGGAAPDAPSGDNWARRGYLAATIAIGMTVIAISVQRLAAAPVPHAWLVLSVLTLLSAWATVRMPGFPMSLSLSDTFIMAAALLFGPAAGALLAGADALVMTLGLNRDSRTLVRVLFNMSAAALSMWLAATLFFALVTPPAPIGRIVLPLALFAAAYFFLNTGLVACALAVGRPLPVLRIWRQHFFPTWLTYGTGASFAGLLLVLSGAGLATLQTLVIALPVILIAGLGLKRGVDRLRERSAQHAALRSYEAALRSTADAVLLTNAEGRVTFINAAAERLTGLTEAAARGRLVQEVYQLQPPVAKVLEAGDAGERVAGVRTLVRHDGTTRPIEETYAYIRDEDERIGGTIRVFRDITRRHEAEQERRALLLREQAARAAADSANRAKDDFLATLSHELRTPAAAMVGWTELLKGGRLDSERTKRAIAALERSARTQAAVLNDLLDVSRVIRGVMRLHVRTISLPDILSEAIDTIEPAVMAKAIQLRVSVAEGIAMVDADPDRLRQILWNLLSNAVKFTSDGGWIDVQVQQEGMFIRIRVSDNGCGIDAQFLPFAFDRFRQADPSDSRSYGGLGLGLAIVQHLVHLHGWTIEATSEGAGRGAQFTIRLPVASHRRRQGES